MFLSPMGSRCSMETKCLETLESRFGNLSPFHSAPRSPSDACVTIYFASDELRSRELHLKTAARELFGELGT